jgi:hypothetical protein
MLLLLLLNSLSFIHQINENIFFTNYNYFQSSATK